MDVNTARIYIRSAIIERAFVQKELLELNRITEQSNQWVMNFKTLSLSKQFLLAFTTLFDEAFDSYPEVQVGGMESGALPFLAALTLYSTKCKNAFYIRKSAKKSDLAKRVEGEILKNVPIIIIDDLINDGTTVKKQLEILHELGHVPDVCFTILNFRDLEKYKPVLGERFKVKSIYSLNDFKDDLPVSNLVEKIPSERNWNKWEPQWKVKLSKHNPYIVVPKSGPVLKDTYIFMGSDEGYIHAIDKNTGHGIWKTKVTYGGGGKRIFSTPVVGGENVYFGAYDGNFYCLDTATGKRRWLFMDADWIGSSPAISQDGKTVYIGLEFGLFRKHGGVAALDTKTGKPRWKYYDMVGLTHASPAVSQQLEVVVCGCNDHYVYCFNEKDGTLRWKFKTNDEVKYGAVFEEKRGLVIIASMDGSVYCINSETGLLEMEFKAQAGFYATPALYKDYIIIGSLDKRVYCFDLTTQKIVWTVETRGRIFSSPLMHENHVFIGSNDGCVYEIDVISGSVLAVVQLPDRVVNRVIVEQSEDVRQLYVATDACDLYKLKEISK